MFGEKILTEKPIITEKPKRVVEGYDPLKGYPLESKRANNAKQELMASFSKKPSEILKEESKDKPEPFIPVPKTIPSTPR